MATINCDMGEAFGLYRMGDDAGLMPLIDIANVACGFHVPISTTCDRRFGWPKRTALR